MLLTKKGVDTLLKRIFESGGLTEDMEKDIQRLRDDFDEREGILKKYGEDYDGELDEYDYKEKENFNSDKIEKYKREAQIYKDRYINRFFGDKEISEYDENKGDEAIEDETLTYDELLEREEK